MLLNRFKSSLFLSSTAAVDSSHPRRTAYVKLTWKWLSGRSSNEKTKLTFLRGETRLFFYQYINIKKHEKHVESKSEDGHHRLHSASSARPYAERSDERAAAAEGEEANNYAVRNSRRRQIDN